MFQLMRYSTIRLSSAFGRRGSIGAPRTDAATPLPPPLPLDSSSRRHAALLVSRSSPPPCASLHSLMEYCSTSTAYPWRMHAPSSRSIHLLCTPSPPPPLSHSHSAYRRSSSIGHSTPPLSSPLSCFALSLLLSRSCISLLCHLFHRPALDAPVTAYPPRRGALRTISSCIHRLSSSLHTLTNLRARALQWAQAALHYALTASAASLPIGAGSIDAEEM
jgi:hypothetical protein